MMNAVLYPRPTLTFAGRKKPAAKTKEQPATAKPSAKELQKPSTLPVYYLTISGGDGSYNPFFFKTEAERDKARAWVDEHDSEPVGDSDGSVTETDVYATAADFIKEREY